MAYHERFHMLLTRAYPMLDSMKDFSFIPEFLEGLEDPRIRIKIEEFVNQATMVTYPLLVREIIQIESTSKAEGEDVGVEFDAGALLDGVEEVQLAGEVGGFDDFGLDAIDGFEVLIIVEWTVYSGNICCETLPWSMATPLT